MAMQDITSSDIPNADGFLRRSVLRVLAWVQAMLANLHYAYIDWISKQCTPFTASGEYLEGWAAIAPTPVTRQPPQAATGTASWPATTGTIPAGTTVNTAAGVQYTTNATSVTSSGATVATITAVVAGSAGNTDAGTPLTLATAITGVTITGAATTAITGGTDLELDASLQYRMLESYAAPPQGGAAADYVTWALEVPGVTRAWVNPLLAGAGTVTVYPMFDVAEAAYGGFPQGTNGCAAAESRGTAASGDQLTVANWIYPLRPVTALVYVVAPTAQPQNFTTSGFSLITTAQQAQVKAAITGLLYTKASPLGTVGIEQSDVEQAILAVGGLPSFAITSPSSWPIYPAVGSILTPGTVTFG